MKFRLPIVSSLALIIMLLGCKETWDKHYGEYPETVDQNIWEAMQNDPQISNFVKVLKESQLDSLFLSDIPYTIFAPTNDAVANYLATSTFDKVVLQYHFASHFINTSNVQGKRQVQTLTEKFALFEKHGSKVLIDGVEIDSESPLYNNGKYFVMSEVVTPRPNLYEYYKSTNPVLSNYIDSQDTIILDKEKSKPLGFDKEGNTVYDTVSIIGNNFETKYFPVKHEFRNMTATIVFPLEEDYNSALDIVAASLGGRYADHNDIPVKWQEQILVPHLLAQGIFLNRIEPEEFIWKSPTDTVKLLNMLGDSVIINYVPVDQALCSNGYAYNYMNFEIPDSLYQGGTKYEGENLLKATGINKYSWNDSVIVKSDIAVTPYQELVPTASNDSILRVTFPKGYSGKYSVEFKGPNLFPRQYVMIVATHMDIGGIYDIYVNNQLVKTFDYYEYVRSRGIIYSVTGARFIPTGRFNKFDMYVDNIEDYEQPTIRFEYKGPSSIISNGLAIDYVEFIPTK